MLGFPLVYKAWILPLFRLLRNPPLSPPFIDFETGHHLPCAQCHFARGGDHNFHCAQYTKDPSAVAYICALSCTLAFDQWANPIQDLGSYDGREIVFQSLFTVPNTGTQRATGSADRRSVSQFVGPNNLMQSCIKTEAAQIRTKVT